jgi:hypothetical protein
MTASLIGWLLHLANASPPHALREEFYALKDRLRARYGVADGHDVQHLRKECWGWIGESGCRGKHCTKCGGSGVFEERWILLVRFRIGGYRFHRPLGLTARRPATIKGRIEHEGADHRAAREASLWLALFFDRRFLLRLFTAGGYLLGWSWHPFSAVQRIAYGTYWGAWMRLRRRFRRDRCWTCERLYFSGLGKQSYNRCRPCARLLARHDEEIPF